MKRSAGIVVFRHTGDTTEVLLLRLGGPLWAGKDGWHFPKGEVEAEETDMLAAEREFHEEVGVALPPGDLIDLGAAQQGPKTNRLWALHCDIDLSSFPGTLETNTFPMEWPPRSGIIGNFPENGKADWFALDAARGKLLNGLVVFLDRLEEQLGLAPDISPDR